MLPAAPVEPLELPEPMLPLLDPVPLALPGVVGLGDVVELGEVLELVPPLAAPEPDLLKCASHSARDT